jgi:hypothetical protein
MTEMQAVQVKWQKVSIERALQRGWRGTQQQFLPLLGIIFVAWAIPIGMMFLFWLLGFIIPKDQVVLEWLYKTITFLISFTIGIMLEMGMIRVQLKVLDGFRPRMADLFEGNHTFINFIVSNTCYNFLLFWGYIMLFVPGVILNLAMQFGSYFVVDKQIGPIEALRASWIASRDARIQLLLAMLLFNAMRSLGFLVLFIGLVPIHMIIILATADLYKQILENTSPEDFDLIEGLQGNLPEQEEFDRTHKIMFGAPVQMTLPAQPIMQPQTQTQPQTQPQAQQEISEQERE